MITGEQDKSIWIFNDQNGFILGRITCIEPKTIIVQLNNNNNNQMFVMPNTICQAEEYDKYMNDNSDKAYRNMRTTKQNQPIVVTGESGAGKTESAKYVLQYLSKSYHACNASIKDRLIKSNLLLEAFGNTKTIHNNNSSRFGEIMEVHFDEEYTIVGGSITYYLFEKTRVCVQSTDEKHVHIFYYLCVDAPARIRKSLQLNSPDTYHHLNQDCSQTKQLTKSYPQDTDFKCEQLVSNLKLNDTNDFIKYDQIMNDIAISQEDKLNIYSILAGILHLGNINFEDDSESTQNGCKIISTSEQALIVTAQMLHVDVHDLWNVLLARISMMKNTIISVPLTVHTAEHVRDKLAKTIYARLFNQLVAYVNTSISFKSSTSHIGIIDTIGFENYPINSFEQFCINYCNEKIQQVFNEHLFETARLLFEEEGIGLNKIDYTDNQDCINLFEDQITGWFHLLDEESNVTERQSNQSTHDIFHGNPNHSMISPKLDLPAASIIHHNEVFLVEHYSGNAVYSTSEFIDKNNDILLDSFIIFVRKSKNEFVKNLFDEIFVEQSKDNINYLSVGTKVRSQMTDIINKVKGSVVHFITCIKPNVKMIPNEFQQDQIRSQLKKLGFASILSVIEEVKHKIIKRECRVRKAQKLTKNIPIKTKDFNDCYNGIFYLFDHHIPQIKQIVFGQQSYDLVGKFQIMEVGFEKHKDDKEEQDKQQTIIFPSASQQQSNEQKSDERLIANPTYCFTLTSHVQPIVGRIYFIRHGVASLFGVTNNTQLSSAGANSSSSSSSSSSLLSSKISKSNRPKKRFCLVRNIDNNKITVLVITTFDGKDPTATKINVVLQMLSRQFLLDRLVAINETAPPPGKKSITTKATSDVAPMLQGYLVLIEAVAPNDTAWPVPVPETFRPSDLQYIDYRLRKLVNDDQSMQNSNDSDTTTTSSFSLPITRKNNE
ncbi:unnamed protein product [Rotaria socialis]|uniref:Myosin motor domain-containing protein n=1 Tax=Rotaria socialis TaxID=392032 RepID=A0A817SNK8_9BILA|nr:unnamed protein product [Rotaria socialis]